MKKQWQVCEAYTYRQTDSQAKRVSIENYDGTPERSLEARKSKEINTVLETFCDKTRVSVICFCFLGNTKN